MVKFPEANARLFYNIFVCKRCKTKIRSRPIKIIQKEVVCRRCNSKSFRAVRKK
ncbi:MAG: 50S ribosomal protein L40e [Nanoarchaeota archaeon]